MNQVNSNGLRIDRWLWFARFFKTRGLAAQAVSGGHVKINGERAKPGNRVMLGDKVDLTKDQLPYSLVAGELPGRRGPASEARQCFTEDEASVARRQEIVDSIRRDRKLLPRTEGRPDKHTRRKLRAHNRGNTNSD